MYTESLIDLRFIELEIWVLKQRWASDPISVLKCPTIALKQFLVNHFGNLSNRTPLFSGEIDPICSSSGVDCHVNQETVIGWIQVWRYDWKSYMGATHALVTHVVCRLSYQFMPNNVWMVFNCEVEPYHTDDLPFPCYFNICKTAFLKHNWPSPVESFVYFSLSALHSEKCFDLHSKSFSTSHKSG